MNAQWPDLESRVLEWIAIVVNHEDSDSRVVTEMRAWVSDDVSRLWALALASVAVTKTLAGQVAGNPNHLLLVTKDDWVMRTITGEKVPDPDVTAAAQAVMAQINDLSDVAADVISKHYDAGGANALLGMARAACSISAALLTPGAHKVEVLRRRKDKR